MKRHAPGDFLRNRMARGEPSQNGLHAYSGRPEETAELADIVKSLAVAKEDLPRSCI